MLIVGGCRQRRVAEFGGLPAGAVLPIELDSPALRIRSYSVPSAADSELPAPSAADPELSASTGARNSGSAALGALNSRIATLGEGGAADNSESAALAEHNSISATPGGRSVVDNSGFAAPGGVTPYFPHRAGGWFRSRLGEQGAASDLPQWASLIPNMQRRACRYLLSVGVNRCFPRRRRWKRVP